MEEYLSIFPSTIEYDQVKENIDFLRPHVSILEDTGQIIYDKIISYDETPDPENLE